MPLSLPPLEEQKVIVEEVTRRLTIIDRVESEVNANIQRAKRLRQSILKRAFEGTLVPQDPTDEPASELLERIREERGRTASRLPPRGEKPATIAQGQQESLFSELGRRG